MRVHIKYRTIKEYYNRIFKLKTLVSPFLKACLLKQTNNFIKFKAEGLTLISNNCQPADRLFAAACTTKIAFK